MNWGQICGFHVDTAYAVEEFKAPDTVSGGWKLGQAALACHFLQIGDAT
jgi:hypothetical protein